MKIVIDTTDFAKWSMRKYDLSNNDWYKIIWRPFMCDYFMNGNCSVGFSKVINPENLFEIHMNEFIEENPHFITNETTVWIEFTN